VSAERSLAGYLGRHRGRVVLAIVLVVLANALEKSVPWLLRHALDALSAGALSTVRDVAIAVVAIAGGMFVAQAAGRMTAMNLGRDVEHDLRNDLLDRLHLLGPSFVGRMGTGEIMSRATNDVGQIQLLIGFGGLSLVHTVVAYAMTISLMVAISPFLTLLAVAPYPLFVLVSRGFARALYQRNRDCQETLGRLSTAVQENVAAVRLVRAYAIEPDEEERFRQLNDEAIRRNMRRVSVRSLLWTGLMGVASIGTVIVIAVGGRMVLRGELTVGEFVAFHAYLGQLVLPTLALGWVLSALQRGRACFGRVREILDATPEVADPPEPRPLPDEDGLTVRDLSFARDGRTVLDSVSLDVPAGGSIAIVGPTGSGKSTLAALLPRLLPTPPGTVFLGGADVTTAPLRELRSRIGYAQQEPFLFSTSVERNIAFGAAGTTDAASLRARVREAARDAAVLDDIESLPEAFDTPVGERGLQLSGGQRQRIALARALLAEPAVIVLDDPLSAVDTRTEAAILRALDRVGRDRTVVLVTHRVAAAARADRVVVLHDGKVVERGTHDELIERGGLYARIAAHQRLSEELDAQ
jgi:ATP-binding cassette subfamily B protein